jgi:hypothetical protein
LSARKDRVQRFAAALRRGAPRTPWGTDRDFDREAREVCEQLAALDRVGDIVIDGEVDRV